MPESDLTDDKTLEYYETLAAYFLTVTLSPKHLMALVAEIRRLRATVSQQGKDLVTLARAADRPSSLPVP